MKLIVTAVLTAVLVLALVAGGAVLVARTGAVDVAASADFLPGAEWYFSTLKRRSVAARAREAVARGDIPPSPEVTEELLRHGADHYRSMCVVCHGAPGLPRGEIGQGLKPHPPDLDRVAREWSPEEIYWVLDNGLRHTGMPAFGRTHSPEELWGLTAFVERLDGMSAEEYRRRSGDAAADTSGHAHGAEDAAGTAAASAGEAAGDDGQGGHDHGGHEH